jgi:transposase
MAVRGLGCPVRFTLTAGQKGDAPQAAALIEGLPAEVVMADTAYDADPLRQAIAAKGAIAVIPNNPSRALKYPLDKHLYAQRHLVECCIRPGALAFQTFDRQNGLAFSNHEEP